MTQEELLEKHIHAMFCLTPDGQMLSINEPWDQSRPAPLLFVGITVTGKVLYRLRFDVPATLVRKAEQLISDGDLTPEHFVEVLHASSFEEELCYWYPHKYSRPSSSTDCLHITPENAYLFESGYFDSYQDEITTAQPYYALQKDGEIVSICRSVRIDTAHEPGIETVPGHRRNGYAQLLLNQWVSEVQSMGNIPFYTHAKGNYPSQNLAEKTGYQLYATTFCIW